MNFNGLSTRSKVLYAIYGVLIAVSVAFVLALLISLGGYYIAGWKSAPVPDMVGRLVAWGLYAFVPLLALRFAVIWSIRKDRAPS
jgi:hypothetical protein